ncbi:MAG: carbohydrate kinase [Acidobacteriota bacterium]
MDSSGPIICLGEAIADLICKRRLSPGEQPDRFVPHPGGALANVAVAIARSGVPSAMAGGVGDDEWGAWLRDDLDEEGVDTGSLVAVEGVNTPVAIVRFDSHGEPRFQIYGQGIGPAMSESLEPLKRAIPASQGLVVGSNTMVGPLEREVTRTAIGIAARYEVPVVLDPNFRPTRWGDRETPARYCRELCASAAVVKLNRVEATLISGVVDPTDAARAIAATGPRLVAVTDGAGPVLTAGAVEARADPEPVEVVSPLGAGDAFAGALTAGLSRLGWDFSRAGELLDEAAAAGTAACRCWGARQ